MAGPFIRRMGNGVLMTASIITGVLFLGGAYVKLFDPDTYWFLSLLTLGLPYLILLLIILFFLWLFFKPLWCVLPVLFLAIGWNAVINIFPPRLKTDFLMKKDAGSIRIMSWNVEQFRIAEKNTAELHKMLDLVNKYNPDILCLQEVVAGDGTRDIIRYSDIEKQLSFRDNFYAYRLKDNFDRHHHFGTAVFSKYPIIRKQLLVNNPDDYNSTFQFVDLLTGKDTIRVFNIHLQSLRFSDEERLYLDSLQIKTANAEESKGIIKKIRRGVEKRAVQARFIKDAVNHTTYPKIVCGDFNDVPVSYAYEKIGKGMQNAFVERGYGLSRTYTEISPTLRIDNIFVDTSFKVLQFRRIKKLLSDHYPIIADVRMETSYKK